MGSVIIPDISGLARAGFSFISLFMSRDDKGINTTVTVNQLLAGFFLNQLREKKLVTIE